MERERNKEQRGAGHTESKKQDETQRKEGWAETRDETQKTEGIKKEKGTGKENKGKEIGKAGHRRVINDERWEAKLSGRGRTKVKGSVFNYV